ncbi:MAG TPA: enoyl-CoA hydratase-related protein [Syntrophales bacterium]|nr:enoyl-CoA hydratase-related protein [Syntrophales bacterium]HQB31637.1 enoyl-CoA hydratase-related protein [Syntrophales bacterium]HQN77828.1 enoyl-CoA hydratase-related protein [Syntrophales bacterium]HQQ28534.1 enoyl-CoA hydratase-related protein [Syntrophales bacterium]
MFENVLFEKKGAVTTITMNRPKSLNALDSDHLADLVHALEMTADDGETRAVVLTGAGKAFCSGGDLASFREAMDRDPADPLRQVIKLLNVAIIGIRTMGKPVIASINGAAGGGGLSVAAACDLRICAASARFRQAYTSIGLVPDGAWGLMIPLLVGFGRASELLFLDPVFDARRALEWGLVHRVVEDRDLPAETEKLALRLAEGATTAFAIAKDNLNHSMLDLLERQLERERAGMVQAGKTLDYREGSAAFFEKRKPKFIGK